MQGNKVTSALYTELPIHPGSKSTELIEYAGKIERCFINCFVDRTCLRRLLSYLVTIPGSTDVKN